MKRKVVSEARSRWMASKKRNRPQQTWNPDIKQWEHIPFIVVCTLNTEMA